MTDRNNGHILWGIIILIVGIALVSFGVCVEIPGGALTTYESLDGVDTDNYAFDNKYSSIDEYVGGDAYNYIIGAALVSGKISGAMTSKAIYIVGGFICVCIGFAVISIGKKANSYQKITNDTIENENEDNSIDSQKETGIEE